MNWFDIIALLIIAVLLVKGLKSGFVRELSGMIATILSLVGARVASLALTPILYEKMGVTALIRSLVYPQVDTAIQGAMNSATATTTQTRESIITALHNMPVLGKFMADATLNEWGITEALQSKTQDMSNVITDTIVTSVSPVAQTITSFLIFAVAFILFSFVLGIIFIFVAKVLHTIPLVGAVDSLLGAVLGAAKGIIFAGVFITIVFAIYFVSQAEVLAGVLDSSTYKLMQEILGFK